MEKSLTAHGFIFMMMAAVTWGNGCMETYFLKADGLIMNSVNKIYLISLVVLTGAGCGPTSEDKCIKNCEASGYMCIAALADYSEMSAAAKWVLCNQESCYRACHAEADAARARQEAKNRQ